MAAASPAALGLDQAAAAALDQQFDDELAERLRIATEDADLKAKPLNRHVHDSVLPHYLTFQAAKSVIATHCMFIAYCFRCAQELATARTIDTHPQTWRPRLAQFRAATAPRAQMFSKQKPEAAPAMRLGFVGCGVVGRTIAESFLDSGLAHATDMAISTRTVTRVSDLSHQGVQTVFDNVAVASDVNILFVCVLAPQLPAIAAEIRECLRPFTLVVVVSSALPTTKLHSLFPRNFALHASSVDIPRLRAELKVDLALRARGRDRRHVLTMQLPAAAGQHTEVRASERMAQHSAAARSADGGGAPAGSPAGAPAEADGPSPAAAAPVSVVSAQEGCVGRTGEEDKEEEGVTRTLDGRLAAARLDREEEEREGSKYVPPAALLPSYLIRGPDHIIGLAAAHASEPWLGALTAALETTLHGLDLELDERKLICLKAVLGRQMQPEHVLQSIELLDAQKPVALEELTPAQALAARREQAEAARSAAAAVFTAGARANLRYAIAQLHSHAEPDASDATREDLHAQDFGLDGLQPAEAETEASAARPGSGSWTPDGHG